MDVIHLSLVSHRDRVHNGSPIPKTRSYSIWHIWRRPENVTYFPQWEHFSRNSEMFGGYLVTENLINFRNRSVRMLRIFQDSREPRLSKPLMRVIIISYWIIVSIFVNEIYIPIFSKVWPHSNHPFPGFHLVWVLGWSLVNFTHHEYIVQFLSMFNH